jgi:uncharacterized protein (TIGR03437 family)
MDTLGVTVVFAPIGSAPALTSGKPSFTPAPGISSPSLSLADANDIVLAWLGNLSATDSKHAVSGIVPVGTITATIPGGAANGQAYAIQLTKVEGDVMGANGLMKAIPMTTVSSVIGPVSASLPLPPVIEPHGVLNAASLSTKAVVSPGTIASLFGLNLAPAAEIDDSIPPGSMLGGTQLLLNGIAAPLFFVSPGQINFEVPTEISGTSAQATVIANGRSSLPTAVQLAPVTPGIFTLNQTGTGPGAVLNQDYSVNSAQNPAAAGSAIMIYATGLGPTNPPTASGQGGGISPPSLTVATPTVLINGAPAEVLYSGLAPGFPGEYQVNAVIPPGTPPGPAVPLQIKISGQASNTATIALQ